MKKIYSFLFVFALILFPLKAFAAVDVTLKDNSTTDIQSVSITVNTGTDTLEKIVLPIQFSEGVTISEVNSGTITCSSLDYVDSTDTVTITCELDTATELSGVLANILFTSDESTYTFTVLDDTDLDIGELELGEVVNIGEVEETVTEEEDTTTVEDPTLISTQESVTTTTQSTGFSIDNLTEYLPYILIAGSVVLLISIIGILLSKKKESSVDETVETPMSEPVQEETPVSTPQQEPTLKDMVNKTEESVIPETPAVEQAQPASVPPVVESTPAENTPTPPVMPTTPPISSGNEEKDLQELMQQETPSIQQEVPQSAPTLAEPMPSSSPETVMPETQPTPSAADLQNTINSEIQNMATQPPVVETPPVQQPVQDTTTDEDLPPVPPTM